jgi:hypothetical protein
MGGQEDSNLKGRVKPCQSEQAQEVQTNYQLKVGEELKIAHYPLARAANPKPYYHRKRQQEREVMNL